MISSVVVSVGLGNFLVFSLGLGHARLTVVPITPVLADMYEFSMTGKQSSELGELSRLAVFAQTMRFSGSRLKRTLFYSDRPGRFLLFGLLESYFQDSVLVGGFGGSWVDQVGKLHLFQIPSPWRAHGDFQSPVG